MTQPTLEALPAIDLEAFQVYRSGAAVTLLCLTCKRSRSVLRRTTLAAIVIEAADHARKCPGVTS